MKNPIPLPNLALATVVATEWDMAETVTLKHMPMVIEIHAFKALIDGLQLTTFTRFRRVWG